MDFTQNYFELLGLPQQYSVDKAVLSENYRQLQKKFHPDKFSSGPENEQRLAVQFSSYINTAYQTLSSPVLCAEYLLLLAGEHVDQQSTTINDNEFLLLQIQWREALAAIATEADINNAEEQLDALAETVKTEGAHLQARFEQQYLRQQYSEAKKNVAKLHFVKKMVSEIDQLESSLFDE